MKNRKLLQTVAAFVATMNIGAAPVQQSSAIEVQGKTIEVSKSNKDAIRERRQTKAQIRANDVTGGLDMNIMRVAYPNPIYSPKKHTF
jgi:hypothetical protein